MTTLREAAQQALEEHVNRYQVVRDGYWWRVKIGTGTQTVGQYHTETGALRLAAELLRAFHDGGFVVQEALRAALAQEEPAPALVHRKLVEVHADGTETWAETPLYTHPPRRDWQSLSEEDINAIWCGAVMAQSTKSPGLGVSGFARAVEAALKEKNNG
jgi:hypothetical protein